jgi:predicted nicotinamide N-methyase
MSDFSIEFECWIDGQKELKKLNSLDRWLVHSANALDVSFTVAKNDVHMNVKVVQKPSHLGANKIGVGACLWDGSLILSAYLLQQPQHQYIGSRVVELGAGVGLVSIVMAKLGANVISTDIEKVLPLLQENVDANEVMGTVDCQVLEWGADTDALKSAADLCYHQYPDYVLAADVTYVDNEGISPDTVEFVKLCRALSNEKTKVLVSLERRSAEVREIFVEEISKHFRQIKLIDLSKSNLPSGLRVEHIDLWLISD